jgi:NAD(P)H dehydrogenase (quinone)
VGRAVACRLTSLGHDVVAVARDIQTASRRLPPEIVLRAADYEDASALKRALAGVDEMVLISSDGEAGAVMRHHANAIEAAVANNIRHITFTSIVDIDDSSPFYFSSVYRDAERRLSLCGVPSSILRCGLYSDFVLKHWLAPNQISGELVLPTGRGRVAPISRDDVAAAVAAVAAKPNKFCATYTITGYRALDFDEIAATYDKTANRQVRYRPCSPNEYLTWALAHLDDHWPYAFSTLCASIAEDRYSQVSKDFTTIAGREPESFRDFLVRATPASPA